MSHIDGSLTEWEHEKKKKGNAPLKSCTPFEGIHLYFQHNIVLFVFIYTCVGRPSLYRISILNQNLDFAGNFTSFLESERRLQLPSYLIT